jgi:hypothetical protein
MNTIRAAALTAALAGLTGLLAVPALASTAASPATPTLVAIRAAHHRGFDRIVFEFKGGLPTARSARYVKNVIAVSGKPIRLVGSAKLQVRFHAANGHFADGRPSFGPLRRTYALPGVIQVARAEDFEAVLRFGVGVARREPFRLFTLTGPSRVVIDLKTPYKTTTVRDYLLDSHRFAHGTPPFTKAVLRPVITPAVAFGALQRLFAGATIPERAAGLRFINSKATGFADLSITDHVARVRLTGGCGSGGSTFTIANEIRPTLKQFSSVRWVKIYDPAGHTERPRGHTDSIPECLEP